jgi:hypothetical protein
MTYKNEYLILNLLIFFIICNIYFSGYIKLLSSTNYNELIDINSSKLLIISNILISIFTIIIICILLYKNKNYLIKILNKNNIIRYCFFILIYFFIYYIFSIVKIINNLRKTKYNNINYDFNINYYILIELIPFILLFIYIYEYKIIRQVHN